MHLSIWKSSARNRSRPPKQEVKQKRLMVVRAGTTLARIDMQFHSSSSEGS